MVKDGKYEAERQAAGLTQVQDQLNKANLRVQSLDQQIQELKGKFSAFMWQSVARLFGHNLKNEFDAEGDDAIINDIVERIESGEIKVLERQVDLTVSE